MPQIGNKIIKTVKLISGRNIQSEMDILHKRTK